MGRRGLAISKAALVMAAASFLAVYAGGVLATGATEPLGTLRVDASPGDNTANSVGPVGTTADVTGICDDGNPEIVVELVIGNSGTQDGGNEIGGIPSGNDIAGWQARILFDPDVLNFIGFLVSDPSEPVTNPTNATAEFYMEKADPAFTRDNPPPIPDSVVDNHLALSNSPSPGVVDIASTIPGTPAGANGVGLLATILFDCVAAGGTCIDIGDGFNSFYTDIQLPNVNHEYAARNSASLAVNGGTTPSSCPAITETLTPAPTFVRPDTTTAPGSTESGGGDDWTLPIIAASSVAGIALITGAAAYWRRSRRRP